MSPGRAYAGSPAPPARAPSLRPRLVVAPHQRVRHPYQCRPRAARTGCPGGRPSRRAGAAPAADPGRPRRGPAAAGRSSRSSEAAPAGGAPRNWAASWAQTLPGGRSRGSSTLGRTSCARRTRDAVASGLAGRHGQVGDRHVEAGRGGEPRRERRAHDGRRHRALGQVRRRRAPAGRAQLHLDSRVSAGTAAGRPARPARRRAGNKRAESLARPGPRAGPPRRRTPPPGRAAPRRTAAAPCPRRRAAPRGWSARTAAAPAPRSSRPMAWLTAGWDMPSSAAAREKLSCWATSTKQPISRSRRAGVHAPVSPRAARTRVGPIHKRRQSIVRRRRAARAG